VVGSASVGATGYLHVFNTLGSQYFVCGVGGHCESGQKMVVNVVAASLTPSESPDKTPSIEEEVAAVVVEALDAAVEVATVAVADAEVKVKAEAEAEAEAEAKTETDASGGGGGGG